MGWHVTNLPACRLLTSQTSCSFLKRTRSLKKRKRRFHWKNKSFLKFDLLFFSITVSTCRNALFFLQIFQPLRKHPARRRFGWRIEVMESFSQVEMFQPVLFSEEWLFWRIFSGWNISWGISFSRNADGQGVCGGAEAYEGFFWFFSTGNYKRPYPTEKGNICS